MVHRKKLIFGNAFQRVERFKAVFRCHVCGKMANGKREGGKVCKDCKGKGAYMVFDI